LYDSLLLNDRVVLTTKDQGVTDEPISKVITNNLALPVSQWIGIIMGLFVIIISRTYSGGGHFVRFLNRSAPHIVQ